VRDLLTGWNARPRVRQHRVDSDLEGVPGWCVEVKRHARAPRGDIGVWWRQAAAQASRASSLPVLFYRANLDFWRAVWPLCVEMRKPASAVVANYGWTVEGSVQAWAAVAQELASRHKENQP
jgi:hypothetical protein